MARYKVFLSKCYELELDAETEDAAKEAALDTPLEQWSDPYEVEIAIEGEA